MTEGARSAVHLVRPQSRFKVPVHWIQCRR